MESALAVLLVLLVILLICREVSCWYFKINETLGVLREIVTELKTLNSKERFK